MTSLQKESEWESRFDKELDNCSLDKPIDMDRWLIATSDIPKVKAFIRETLANREKEIAEEVSSLYADRKINPDITDNLEESYDKALDDVLSILKH